MNNLHRELAPISDAAWAQIEEEASRTLKRYLAARRVVDVEGPQGATLSAVGFGRTQLLSCVIMQGLVLASGGVFIGSALFAVAAHFSKRTPLPRVCSRL